jgi:methylase of polypeptide subunit release factors
MVRPTIDNLLRMELSLGDGAWVPTPHGELMAEVLAENNLVEGLEVLELGAGAGNHTIIMARQGAASIVATEITVELLEIARETVRRNCPAPGSGATDRVAGVVEFRVADWLAVEGRYDVIVSNPPFCKSGKQNRRYYIDSLILDAHKHLRGSGSIVFVQSSMADLPKTMRGLTENGFEARILGERVGPFRDYYFEDETFMREIRQVPGGFEERDGQYFETLYVIAAELLPFTPPSSAHAPPGPLPAGE